MTSRKTGRDGGNGDNESDLDVAKQIAMQMAGKYLFRNDDGSVDKRPDGHKLAAYVAVNRDPDELFRPTFPRWGWKNLAIWAV